MMPDELVEKVARALWRSGGYATPDWDKADETPLKERHRQMARDAIAAMPRIEALVEALRDIASIDRAFVEANGTDGALGKIIDRALAALQGESEATAPADK